MRSAFLRTAIGAAALSLTLVAEEAEAKTALAVVDLDRCKRETEDGLRAQAKLKKLADRYATILGELEADMARQHEIMKTAKVGSVTWERADARFREGFQRHHLALYWREVELRSEEARAWAPIEKRMAAVIAKFGAKSDYALILDRKAVPWQSAADDVTDQVIDAYNTRK